MKLFIKIAITVFSFLSLTLSVHALERSVKNGDTLQIAIRGVPQEEAVKISGTYVVDNKGQVFLPMIVSGVRASGLSSSSLSRSIEASYQRGEIYTQPRITVINVTAQGEVEREDLRDEQKIVTVGGQVRRNGPVQWRKGITLFEAIQAGGGPTEFGNMKKVKVVRGNTQKIYDMNNNKYKLLKLYPFDIIEVPQKGAFDGLFR